MRVHLRHPSEAPDALAAALPDGVRLTDGPEVPDDVEVLVHGVPERLPEGLAGLVIPYAGLPGRTRRLLADRPDVRVHNLHHNAGPVAEMALALLLAAARRLVPADAGLRTGDWSWRYRDDPSVVLEGGTAVVVGFGAIGRRVARLPGTFGRAPPPRAGATPERSVEGGPNGPTGKMKRQGTGSSGPAWDRPELSRALLGGLGMDVVAVRRSGRLVARDGLRVVPVSGLDDALAGAAAVVIACPLTDETRGLFDAERLARLPPTAVLVNVARAGIVDAPALFAALTAGRLHAAGLDVWWRVARTDEPAPVWPSELPFHTLDNVVLSPHRAAHVRTTEVLRMRALGALLAGTAEGREVNRVDVGLGY